MAAGLGFKDFTTGEVLTAGDVDGYLMQGIWVFASAAARDAAVTSPQEGNFAFTKDTNGLWYYDGAAWVASGATGDIEGVTAGIGISGGGTSGTVTVTNSMATAIDAKGDLVVGTGADTFAKLTVGANGTILTADSAEATGMKWATASGGGGMTLLSTGTFSGSTLTFSSISQNYVDLVVVMDQVYGSAVSGIGLRLNNSTTNSDYNSSWMRFYGGSTGQGAQDYGTQSYVTFGVSAAANTQNQKLYSRIIIPRYTQSAPKSIIADAVFQYNENKMIQKAHGVFFGSAITELKFILDTGTFTDGTAYLYGVK